MALGRGRRGRGGSSRLATVCPAPLLPAAAQWPERDFGRAAPPFKMTTTARWNAQVVVPHEAERAPERRANQRCDIAGRAVSEHCALSPAAALSLLPEAVAYIGAGARRSVSPRVICLDAFSEGLGTADFASLLMPRGPGWTYATASPRSGSRPNDPRQARLRAQSRALVRARRSG